MLLMCVTSSYAYSIDYIDFSQPTAIERFPRPSVCAAMADTSQQALGKSFEVLTENTVRELAGWSCEVISSEWHYCYGVFSHLEAYPDHVVCQGEETREGDKLTENALILMELRVMIWNGKFLASHNCMESKSEHMQLPCNVTELG